MLLQRSLLQVDFKYEMIRERILVITRPEIDTNHPSPTQIFAPKQFSLSEFTYTFKMHHQKEGFPLFKLEKFVLETNAVKGY